MPIELSEHISSYDTLIHCNKPLFLTNIVHHLIEQSLFISTSPLSEGNWI